MDSPDGLFLSEGVCRQLGIIKYHDEIRPVKDSKSSKTDLKTDQGTSLSRVPLVQVSLVKSVNLLPHQSIVAQVQCDMKDTTCLARKLITRDGSAG